MFDYSISRQLYYKWDFAREVKKVFEEQVFESLEINPSKKIFKINGEDFGKRCYKYDISICQREGEIIVSFYRYGATVFESRYNAMTGKIKKSASEGSRR